MLVFIEGTVVKQRLMNMRELRQMGAVDEWVLVYVIVPPACEQQWCGFREEMPLLHMLIYSSSV